MDILSSNFEKADSFIVELENRFGLIKFNKGESIFEQGGPDASIYIVKSGNVRLSTHYDGLENSVEACILRLSARDAVGALSFFDGNAHKASAVADSDVEAIKVSQADFVNLRKDSSDLSDYVMMMAIKALQSMVSVLILRHREREIMLRGHVK